MTSSRWLGSPNPEASAPALDLGVCSSFGLGSLQQALRKGPAVLPRKEVIQPQLPLRLPCYDFVPITRPTLDAHAASGVAGFHDVTGGVYKARERIHRGVLTHGY